MYSFKQKKSYYTANGNKLRFINHLKYCSLMIYKPNTKHLMPNSSIKSYSTIKNILWNYYITMS